MSGSEDEFSDELDEFEESHDDAKISYHQKPLVIIIYSFFY